MFDWIEFEVPCPKCGEKVDGFQSKSGPCGLYVLKPWQVDNFYSDCEVCGTRLNYEHPGLDGMEQVPPDGWLDKYTLRLSGDHVDD